MNKLIEDINNYISYLNASGLSVSVHGKIIGGLIEHNTHKNPFCSFVKTNDEAWEKCIKCQQRVFGKSSKECFFGMCYAGVEEYVFFVDDKTFVSVSGYGVDKGKAMECIHRLAHEYRFEMSELLTAYQQGLKHEKEDISQLSVMVKPLCHMLSLLQITIGENSILQTNNKTFDSILAYVQRNFMHDLTLRGIADACACSESTISHLFKAYTDQPVKKYINELRMKQAEKLLLTTNLPISNIASLCGFADTNYFSTAFKKKFGLSPVKFRANAPL